MIENDNLSSAIYFHVRDTYTTLRRLTINQFINMYGINDLNCSRVVCGKIKSSEDTTSRSSVIYQQ